MALARTVARSTSTGSASASGLDVVRPVSPPQPVATLPPESPTSGTPPQPEPRHISMRHPATARTAIHERRRREVSKVPRRGKEREADAEIRLRSMIEHSCVVPPVLDGDEGCYVACLVSGSRRRAAGCPVWRIPRGRSCRSHVRRLDICVAPYRLRSCRTVRPLPRSPCRTWPRMGLVGPGFRRSLGAGPGGPRGRGETHR